MAQAAKNLPTMQKTRVQFLGWEDPLEKGMATHSSILAWRIPWTEESGGLYSVGSQRVGHDWRLILPYKYLMYLSDFGDRLSCTTVLQFLIFVMGFIFWIVSFY